MDSSRTSTTRRPVSAGAHFAAPSTALRAVRRGLFRARGTQPSRAGWMLHFSGMFALLAGLLMPLTDLGQALANPDAPQNRPQFSQDAPQGAPQSVVLTGDFQGQLGCGDFDAGCQQSELQNNDGIWTGQSPVGPGSYQYTMVVNDASGNQVNVGDGSVDVGDNQTGIYYSYNAHTNEVIVSALDALFTVETDDGTFVPEQDGDQLTVLIPSSQGGQTSVQLTANGEAVGEPQQVDLAPGSNRVTLDLAGAVVNVEALPYATLTVQRTDADGGPLTGSCFEIRDRDTLINQGCDADDGSDDGSTVMSFPGGFDAGNFTLVETRAPDGIDAAPDQDITLEEGDNTIQVQSEGGGGGETPEGADGGDATQTPEGADGGDATQTPEVSDVGDATNAVVVEPGDLIVTLQDGDGNPVGGACFQLIDDQENVVAEACDTNDNFPNNGNVGFFGVPSGTYTLHESTTPEGSATVDDQDVDVPAGAEDTVVVQTSLDEVTPEATDEPTEEATGVPTEEATEEATVAPSPTEEVAQPGDLIVSLQDADGNPVGGACFQLIDDQENVIAEACDTNDNFPNNGNVGFFGIPAGTYTLHESITPEGFATAEDQDVEIAGGEETTLSVITAANAEPTEVATEEATVEPTEEATVVPTGEATDVPTEEATVELTDEATDEATQDVTQTPESGEPGEPGDLIVTLNDESGNALGGACFELVNGEDVVASACDSDDPFPGNGRTGFFGVPSGTFTLRESTTPDGYTTMEPVEVTVVAGIETDQTVTNTPSGGDQPTDEASTPDGNEDTPEAGTEGQTGVLFDFSAFDLSGSTVCVELNTSGGIGLANPPAACDNDNNDGDQAEGRILLTDVPAGEYAVIVTDGPEEVTALEIPAVTVVDGETVDAQIEAQVPEPTATTVPEPTATTVPEPTATTVPEPTATTVPEPTATTVPEPTATTVPEPGAVEVVLEDESGNTLTAEGTCVQVDGVVDNVCDNGEGDANNDTGVILVEEVPAGSYSISVTTPADGYDAPDGATDVDVAAGETASEPVSLPTAAPETGTLTVRVVDGDGNAIAGGCFTVSNSSGSFEFCDEDGDGTIEIPDVVFGEQTVTQTLAADGNVVDATPQTPTLDADNPNAELSFTNAAASANLPVSAVDGDANALPGACWTVSNADGEELAGQCDDGSNGDTADDGTVLFSDLPVGDLTVTETTTPAGFTTVEPVGVTTVNGDNDALIVSHQVAPITVQVTTEDGEGNPHGAACVALDGGEPVCDDDGDGVVSFENVAPGDHVLTQTTAPDGFEAAPELPVTIEVGGETQFVMTNDTVLAGSVEITIVDGDGNPIEGACAAVGPEFSACDNDDRDVDDGDGLIRIDGVTPGTYDLSISGLDDTYLVPDPVSVTVEAGAVASATISVEAAPPLTGTVKISVQTNESGDAIADGCVVLSQNGTVVVGPVCDNDNRDADPADGVLVVEDVPVGTYTVSLDPASTDAIDGFLSASTRSVTVSAAQQGEVVIAVIVQGQDATGTVEIVTRDNATNLRIDGACYALGDLNVCDGDAQDANGSVGIIQLDDVRIGDYTLTMTTAPTGYETSADQAVTVEGGALNRVDVRVDALPALGSLTINKVDPNGAALGDSCFDLVQDGRTVRSICDALDDSPSDGVMVLTDLDAGRYRLVETQAPSSGFQVADPQVVTIVAGEDTTVTVTNQPKAGRIMVTKVDAADANSRLVSACFRLEGELNYGPFCDASDGSNDGRIGFNTIRPGDYTLVETVAPEGYVAAAPLDVTVQPGSFQQITVANAVAPPPETTGTLVVHKLDGDQKVLPGGCFRLFDGNTPVTSQVCDNADGTNDGLIRFVDAPAGTWTLRETLAPSASYQIADGREVTIRDGQTIDVDVINVLKRGRVLVNVRNEEGQVLQGACFDLASDGKGHRCSDASGVVSYPNLVSATYRLTSTAAPYGYDRPAGINGIQVRPGETTVINVTLSRTPPPDNSGSVQVQTFYCPAGTGAERTQFLGGADGSAQLRKTSGCSQGNAAFTLALEGGSGNPFSFSVGDDGQYQTVAGQGTYVLTEADPDLEGESSTRLRVFTGQQTTVVVINYLAPPEPEPTTINVTKYTCAPSFNGTLYQDFAQNCSDETQLTNNITVRAQGPVNTKGVTGDKGRAGQTSITGLQPGTYSIFEDRPYNIPTDYLFCGFNQDNPSDWKAVNGKLDIALDYGQTLTCKVFDIPEILTDDSGTILVRKYVCEVKNPPKGYNWEEECKLSNQGSEFDLRAYNGEIKDYGDASRGQANPDGLLRFTRLPQGTYQLREVDGAWCHAESNSVNAQGDVIVNPGKLSVVWIYNCVDTTVPPNTGSGSAATWTSPGSDGPSGLGITLSLIWPVLAAGAWFTVRRHRLLPQRVEIRRAA